MNSLSALLTQAAFAPITNTGWLRVTGSDRVRWLNGMVTNSIQALAPGEGNYSFLLNAQGRIQGDLTAWMLDDAILLETTQPAAVAALLDRFIIMDDVELTPMEDHTGILIAGPQALAVVQALGTGNHSAAPCTVPLPTEQTPAANSPYLKQTLYAGAPVSVIRAHSPIVPRFEIWSNPATLASIADELRGGQVVASEADVEHLRLLEGTPRYGIDIRNTETAKDLPQETNQTRALHSSKGCYLGQEIVERIRSRGQVHRSFTGFLLAGALPAPGTVLTADSTAEAKPVGEITSAAAFDHPAAGPLQLALGYLRREALDRKQPAHYPGGTATPIALPYIP